MCTGAAVYSALDAAQVRWSDRVGVLGVVGLGHLAIQFASKMGCHVMPISNSPNKEADSRSFGAVEFHCLSSMDEDNKLDPVDALLLTGSQQPNWSQVIPIAKRGSVITTMTVDPEDMCIPYMHLVMNAISISGGLPASPPLQRGVLEFAALHEILPVIETFAFTEDGINEAMEKLRRGGMR